MSLEELLELIKMWEKTSPEIYNYFKKRSEHFNKDLNCYLHIENNLKESSSDSLLQWLPIAFKDMFATEWMRTTAASKMLENFTPPYSATLVEKMQDSWASILWKCNQDDSAMWWSGENSAFGNTLNPWGKNRVPGWSSSGSAAAVAAWLVPASFGTDTGWSTRQPASFCWIVGFKPSYWRNSRYWVFPMASSLDCPATFTKTVKDAGLLYDITSWEDPKDANTIVWKDTIQPNIWETNSLEWKTIWVPREYFDEWLDPKVKVTIEEAIEKMKSLWATIKDISLPMTKYGVTTYYILMPAEVATNIARLDGIRYWYNSDSSHSSLDEMYQNNRWEGLGEEVQRRTIIGNYVLSAWFYDAYFKKAAQVRTLIIEDFEKAFSEVDAIISPASPWAAWKIWEKSDDPLSMYLQDAYTVPASLAGLPWISVPCGFVEDNWEKLPVWLQILTPRFEDQRCLEIAHVYEQAAGWREQMIPEGFED